MSKVIEIPKGFKYTNVGVIPCEWEVVTINEIGTVVTGSTPSRAEIDFWNGSICWATAKDFNSKYISNTVEKVTTKGSKFARLVPKNSVLITCIASIGNNAIAKVELATNQQINSIVVNKRADFELVYYLLEYRKPQLKLLAGKTAVPIISKGSFEKFKIPLPTIEEQSKIANILCSWDTAIGEHEKLLLFYQKRRNGLDQQLLSGKNRLPEFIKSNLFAKTPVGELPEDWELKHISDITQRVKKSITPEPEKLYREIGIRSHCKGIFHKEEVTGASLGNKSVFWIQPDCFVVNIVFAWEHAIAKTTEAEVGMIASHRFPMYKPKKGVLDLDYLLYYFKTARGKHLLGLASPGGAGRNKTLGQGEFAKLKIPVPSLTEQKRIVTVLSEADKEIELMKQQIATLKEQKKGLMQKLLTGEIRTI